MFKFLDKWGTVIMISLLLIIGFRTCGNSSEMEEIKKENQRLQKKVEKLDSVIIKPHELEKLEEEVMYETLLYEYELDRDDITFSRIKEKMESDDKLDKE